LGGVFYVAKLTTATPDMFQFPVSVMVLVMVVLGGMGSIRGVVVAALFIAFLQSVVLQELPAYVQTFVRLMGNAYLQKVQLITALELIFGCILVLMMLFRREGLFPAVRHVAALTREQQTVLPALGTTVHLSWAGTTAAAPGALLEIVGLTKRFGGVAAAEAIYLTLSPSAPITMLSPNRST